MRDPSTIITDDMWKLIFTIVILACTVDFFFFAKGVELCVDLISLCAFSKTRLLTS